MNILDENIPESQRQLLRDWRVPIRKIGHDLARKGLKGDEIIPFLHTLRRPTFFTRDLDFYKRHLCHARYCLVYLAVGQYEVATFARRLLRHSEFSTQVKRMGCVIRASRGGLSVWQLHTESHLDISWDR